MGVWEEGGGGKEEEWNVIGGRVGRKEGRREAVNLNSGNAIEDLVSLVRAIRTAAELLQKQLQQLLQYPVHEICIFVENVTVVELVC